MLMNFSDLLTIIKNKGLIILYFSQSELKNIFALMLDQEKINYGEPEMLKKGATFRSSRTRFFSPTLSGGILLLDDGDLKESSKETIIINQISMAEKVWEVTEGRFPNTWHFVFKGSLGSLFTRIE